MIEKRRAMEIAQRYLEPLISGHNTFEEAGGLILLPEETLEMPVTEGIAMTDELDPKFHERIKALCARGDELAQLGQYAPAVAAYNEALHFIPQPISQWEASTWILTAIGDALFFAGDFEEARAALTSAMHCPGAIGNPFIHLRLGQVQFELGNLERAKDELARAYMGAGAEIFDQDDPKYLAFIREYLKDA